MNFSVIRIEVIEKISAWGGGGGSLEFLPGHFYLFHK